MPKTRINIDHARHVCLQRLRTNINLCNPLAATHPSYRHLPCCTRPIPEVRDASPAPHQLVLPVAAFLVAACPVAACLVAACLVAACLVAACLVAACLVVACPVYSSHFGPSRPRLLPL